MNVEKKLKKEQNKVDTIAADSAFKLSSPKLRSDILLSSN